MALLVKLTVFCGMFFLVGLLLVVAWKMLTGGISLDGLLESVDRNGRRSFSPARAQLLAATIVVAAKYVFVVIQSPQRDALPGLPSEYVAVLGGSQLLFLGGKTIQVVLSQFNNQRTK